MFKFYLLCLVILPYLTTALKSRPVDVTLLGSNTHLGNKVYNILAAKKKGNLIFSPFSLHAVLALLYSGADGKTKADLQRVLQLPKQKNTSTSYKKLTKAIRATKKVTLEIANKVYAANDVKLVEDFKTNALSNFDAEIENVNFGSGKKTAARINAWVQRKTHNKIKDLISSDSIDGWTRLILVNTLYFNGEWTYPLAIEKRKFYISEKEKVDCTMMLVHGQVEYYRGKEFKFVRIPYKDNEVTLSILLPNSRTGIAQLEKKVTSDKKFFKFLLWPTENDDEVIIPKFKIKNNVPLTSILKKIGLKGIFEGLNTAKMVQSEDSLVVSNVLQKAFIDVNENGTEAAAATEMKIVFDGEIINRIPFKFVADHPFLFFLEKFVDGKRLVLFQGRFSTPN